MQDSAPCHTAKLTKRFLDSHNIPTIKWPANSPDLNPIENVWGYLKEKIVGKHNMTVSSVEKAVKEYWTNDLDMAYLKNSQIPCQEESNV